MTPETLTAENRSVICKLHYKKIRAPKQLPALSEVFCRLESVSILGGNTAKANADRFSYWAAGPKDIFEFKAGQNQPFEKLQRALAKYKLEKNNNNKLPKGIFYGGWIGYFSYELGRFIERLPETMVDDIKMPLIRLCFYDKITCYDHLEGNWWLIALEMPNDTEKPQQKLASLEKLLDESREVSVEQSAGGSLEDIDFSKIRCNMDKDYYLEAVKKIKHHIYEGDVYQVNFSQRFECDYRARPMDLYHWQNYYNPSPYAAYIDTGDFQIVSASPEMFITIDDGVISTKPIKGTRPRFSEIPQKKQANEENFNELLHSEKEKAELNMIVDLERNDIAKICIPGTRKVVQPRTIESYPTVFHAVATVAGRLREQIRFGDILKAIFPGGSITGAPKVSSMEIIERLEPTARGVYTGAIGFIGIDGSACLNIAIRTIIIKGQKAFAQTGGGIVADSDAEAEWQETLTKARALLAGIRSVNSKIR